MEALANLYVKAQDYVLSMEMTDYLTVGFFFLIGIFCILAGISFSGYLKRFRIFGMIYAKLRGRVEEQDRIRRSQMKEAFKEDDILSDKKGDKGPSIMESIYHDIALTGIANVIPGFSEGALLSLVILITLIFFGLTIYYYGLVAALVASGAILFVTRYILSIVVYSRRVSVESQLLDFINQVTSVSRQFSNLVDIIGSIYGNFSGPLSRALEEFYVEVKKTNNSDLAVKHLKAKFDSKQFAFVVDNLFLCSNATGDFSAVSRDLAKIVSIYTASHEKKQAILRDGKVQMIIMFGLSIAAIFATGKLFNGVEEILRSSSGIIFIALSTILLFYGLNMKAENE